MNEYAECNEKAEFDNSKENTEKRTRAETGKGTSLN
jgi:hypothetical protein